MKNKKYLIIIGVVLVVLLVILGILLLNKKEKVEEIDNNVYIIHLDNGYRIYDMESYHNKIMIKKSDVVMCITEPCNPILVEDYSITNKNKYRDKFKELVGDKKEITLDATEVDKDTIKLFGEILNEDLVLDEEETPTYKDLGSSDNKDYKTRGYYVEEKDNKVIITLAMGEESTGGYSINIVKVNMIDDGVQIYFEENIPSEKDVVTEAFTYPITQIELDKMPKYVKAQSLDNYEELTRVN